MARRCTVCTSRWRKRIERDLILNRGSKRRIAARYGVSLSSLLRHSRNHLRVDLGEAQRQRRVLDAVGILEELASLLITAKRLLERAEASGRIREALTAVQRVQEVLESLHELVRSAPEPGPRAWDLERLSLEELRLLRYLVLKAQGCEVPEEAPVVIVKRPLPRPEPVCVLPGSEREGQSQPPLGSEPKEGTPLPVPTWSGPAGTSGAWPDLGAATDELGRRTQ